MASKNLYIHFPFCRSRCAYCDFYSTVLSADWAQRYVKTLQEEILQRVSGAVQNVYLGGGTPSLMRDTDLYDLMATVRRASVLADDAEITIEANPDDIDEAWVSSILSAGFNRVSMGVQSFNDEVLQFVGRRHNAMSAERAVRTAKERVNNVSIDLIYGLPLQTVEDFRGDVLEAIELGVEHISAYALTYEEGTRLWHLREGKALTETSDDTEWRMYELLMDQLAQAGYEHYEISNFARPGYQARHNSGYWDGTHYIGVGAAAHSYDGVNRRWNVADIRAYIDSPGQPPFEGEQLSEQMRYEELLMTRLRTRKGLCLADVPEPFIAQLDKQKIPHLMAGNLIEEDGVLRLTRKGIFRSDDIIADLF
ncbi:MAG: radical SAM family heme chaperone HemW [Alloprevotella sp.]|nr:radical SAM family heme chaperone HemW [Alloprevotella sp.]